MMVWTLPDAVIESPALLEQQFEDLRRNGFDGVAVYVRCSRYTWDDPPAREALARISTLCRQCGMHFWIGPDPRFISRALIGRGCDGAELLLFGDSTRAEKFPNLVPVINGRFSVRCELRPRHAHMFNEVALEYIPLGVLRCYAVRRKGLPLGRGDVFDITRTCHFFYNARDRYVEAFGWFTPPQARGMSDLHDAAPWSILTFFHAASSHVDYSNRRQMTLYENRLRLLRKAGVLTDSLMWDEPGYTCTYGSLPFTPAIRNAFRHAAGYDLEDRLWKLAMDAADGSHISLRRCYFQIVQESVNAAQRSTNREMHKLWGPRTLASVHDTWHFESADMCDMNHGSLDLWRGARVKSGGFVDLGSINELRDPENPYYANLAAMSVIAASLGRHSQREFAFNNLWTVGDDENGWQRSVMDHCVNVLALFGTRWLAHAYGPVGTIGQEGSFLGSPPLPGYPRHSTWSGFPEWNGRLRRHAALTGGRLPDVNLLMVFPVETMYALADKRADERASALFSLVLALVDAQYPVDVLSPEMVMRGHWHGGRFLLGRRPYEAVILPFACAVDGKLLQVLHARTERNAGHRTLVTGTGPEWVIGKRGTRRARPAPPAADSLVGEIPRLLAELENLGVSRPVRGPDGSWVTATHTGNGLLASVVPSRHGGVYEGPLKCGESVFTLPRAGGLTQVLFPRSGSPGILEA